MDEAAFKKKLTPEQYHVLRERGTETPFSGEFVSNDDKGIYKCAACDAELFSSDTKQESTTPGLMGWPSFGDVIKAGAVELRDDTSMGMHRTEVVCKNCGSHLGHLFDDASMPTGKHYCINSLALAFDPSKSGPPKNLKK
ncbi:MAG: Peptide methionine sulfoxide reductase MsrB [Candidatus Saccharibacteria bacterium]|nr:Peptide methionine sulfoxide reductase MsrB [Candidatus Saccharibacteria bacterium]